MIQQTSIKNVVKISSLVIALYWATPFVCSKIVLQDKINTSGQQEIQAIRFAADISLSEFSPSQTSH